jgi:hypothetical protein
MVSFQYIAKSYQQLKILHSSQIAKNNKSLMILYDVSQKKNKITNVPNHPSLIILFSRKQYVIITKTLEIFIIHMNLLLMEINLHV